MTYRALQETKNREYVDSAENVSTSTVARAVRTLLSGGQWTFKKLTPVHEKFDGNIAYCDEYVNFLHEQDPNNIQFFDEAGIKLSKDLTPRFGHALRGTVNEQSKYNVTCDLLR